MFIYSIMEQCWIPLMMLLMIIYIIYLTTSSNDVTDKKKCPEKIIIKETKEIQQDPSRIVLPDQYISPFMWNNSPYYYRNYYPYYGYYSRLSGWLNPYAYGFF